MSFTVVSWNVEHFGKGRPRDSPADVRRRIDDVFALLPARPTADRDAAIASALSELILKRGPSQAPCDIVELTGS